MAKQSNINREVPMEQFQHQIPVQLKFMLVQMSGFQGEPTRDTVNKVLAKRVFEYFENMSIMHIVKLKYKEIYNMPWFDDFFDNGEAEVDIEIEEGDDEEDTLLEETAN